MDSAAIGLSHEEHLCINRFVHGILPFGGQEANYGLPTPQSNIYERRRTDANVENGHSLLVNEGLVSEVLIVLPYFIPSARHALAQM